MSTIYSPKPGCCISSSLPTAKHCFMWHFLAIIRPSNLCHEVNENSGDVDSPTIFTSGIITWENMMIVVEALTNCSKCNKEVFGWINMTVIRFVTPQVSRTVDCPGGIQCQSVAENSTDEITCPRTLSPEVPWYKRWHHKAQQHYRRQIQPKTK